MKKSRTCFICVFIIIFFFHGCFSTKEEEPDLNLSQNDIDLLIKHKKKIDKITGKYDKELSRNKKEKKADVLEKGKKEIDEYLKSNNLFPKSFMRKSKKILKGYLAFIETGNSALEKRAKEIEAENFTAKEFEEKMNLYKQSNQALFKELTTGLSDYEIQLIESNLKNISAIMK